MKLFKLFAIALAAVSVTACSDDDNSWNSVADVTVSMGESAKTISEDVQAGKYDYLPIVVSGEANGPIQVTVEVTGVSESPAVEDKHYVITSKTVTIPAGETSANIEFYATGDNEINDDRQFEVTIVKAEGAAIGSNATCTVTLKDNEGLLPAAYESMFGNWTFKASQDTQSGTVPQEFILTCTGAEEGAEGYLTTLKFTGFMGFSFMEAVANFSFDASTNCAIISFPMGQCMCEDLDLGDGLYDILLATVVNGTSLSISGSVSATSNEEITEFTFADDAALFGAAFKGSSYAGGLFYYYSMSMTR